MTPTPHQHLLGIPGVRIRLRPPVVEDEAADISVFGRGGSDEEREEKD